MPEEFKSNSFKSREAQQLPAEKKEPMPLTGKIVPKKKNLGQKFVETFIAEDIRSVREAVVKDVLIPKIKEIVTNMINETVNRLFYGRAAGPANNQERSTVYHNLSNGVRTSSPPREVNRTAYAYNDIEFTNRLDAENILLKLKLEIEHYGNVSVGYYREQTDRDTEPTDYKYGWRNLKTARVSPLSNGSFELILPRPEVL